MYKRVGLGIDTGLKKAEIDKAKADVNSENSQKRNNDTERKN